MHHLTLKPWLMLRCPALALLLLTTLATSCSFSVHQAETHDFAEDKVAIRIPANIGDYAPPTQQNNPEQWPTIQAEADRACQIYDRTASNIIAARCGLLGDPDSILFKCREWEYLFACSLLGGPLAAPPPLPDLCQAARLNTSSNRLARENILIALEVSDPHLHSHSATRSKPCPKNLASWLLRCRYANRRQAADHAASGNRRVQAVRWFAGIQMFPPQAIA